MKRSLYSDIEINPSLHSKSEVSILATKQLLIVKATNRRADPNLNPNPAVQSETAIIIVTGFDVERSASITHGGCVIY